MNILPAPLFGSSQSESGLPMMTGGTERLEVRGIPEQFRVALMFHNVVDLELMMNHPTGSTGISRFDEHPFPFPLPAFPIIQAPDDPVGALLFLHAGMGRTAPFRDQHTAARGHAELHTYAISVIVMPCTASTIFFRSL